MYAWLFQSHQSNEMSAGTKSFLPNHRDSMNNSSLNGMTGEGIMTSRGGSAPVLYDDESDAGGGSVGSSGNLYKLYHTAMKTSDGPSKGGGGIDNELITTQDNTPVVSHSSRKKPMRTSFLERASSNQLPSSSTTNATMNTNTINPHTTSTSVLPVTGSSISTHFYQSSVHEESNHHHYHHVDGSKVVDIESPTPSTIVV